VLNINSAMHSLHAKEHIWLWRGGRIFTHSHCTLCNQPVCKSENL